MPPGSPVTRTASRAVFLDPALAEAGCHFLIGTAQIWVSMFLTNTQKSYFPTFTIQTWLCGDCHMQTGPIPCSNVLEW